MPQTTEHLHARSHGVGTAQAFQFAGVLVANVELEPWSSTYEPADTCLLFRSPECWTTLTLRRTEKWTDYGEQPDSGMARVIIEDHPTASDLSKMIQDAYGFAGWAAVLDAGSPNDSDLRRLWVPVQVERDLDQASFYRPGVVEKVEAGDPAILFRLRAEIELELASAGFNVRQVVDHACLRRAGDAPVIASAVLRRYGHEFDTIVRVDAAGEIYTRLLEDAGIREVEEDDDDA